MGKTTIRVACIDQRLVIKAAPVVASGGKNEDVVIFEFCPLWEGFEKTAVFYRNKDEVYHAVVSGDQALIPHEVLAEEGTLYFGVFGVKDDITRTSEVLRYRLTKGALTEGTKPSDPTPDIYTQFLNEAQALHEEIAAYDARIAAVQKQANATDTKVAAVQTQANTTNTNVAAVQKQAASADAKAVAAQTKAAETEKFVLGSDGGSSHSGDRVLFETIEGAPFEAVTAFSPAQEGVGDASVTNVRPIVEHTGAALTHCGKNLLPFPYFRANGFSTNGVTLNYSDDGEIVLNGTCSTATANAYFYLTPYDGSYKTGLRLPVGNYTLSSGIVGSSSTTYRLQASIYKDGAYKRDVKDWDGTGVTFEVREGELVDLYIAVLPGVTVTDLKLRPQIEHGSVATAYEPYRVGGHAVEFPRAVGGGWIDWNAGTVTMTHEIRALTGLESWGETISDAPYYFLSIEKKGYVDESGEQLCSHFVRQTITNATTGIGFSVFNSSAGDAGSTRIAIRPNISSVTDKASWKTYLWNQVTAGTPVTVLYKLANPRVLPITPQVLRALDETNLLSCDLGVTTVTIPANLTNLLRVDAQAQTALPPVKSNVRFTEFDWLPGRWNAVGSWSSSANYSHHSQPIPAIGGKQYYLGFKYDTLEHGAFFDSRGNWIAPLRVDDVTAYAYLTADGTGTAADYAELYTFTAPEGASYFSYNLTDVASRKYRQFVASSPVFALANTGNYAWNDDEPIYQAKRHKRLCIIGASGVTLNRAERETPKGSGTKQYIIGFPEYLVPWYAKVDSYGYAGTPWGTYGEESTKKTAIYTQVSDLDFSQYDEFILNPSTNGLPDIATIGSVDSIAATTYMGALNLTIQKIYAESPNAKVYIVNLAHKGSYYTDADSRARYDALNDAFVELTDSEGLELIDLIRGGGINRHNYAQGRMTYDGTHLNQEGNKAMGLCLRKHIVGF